jgi:hypothetical protein
MKLGDYIGRRGFELGKFDKYWRDNHKKNPGVYPIDMTEEDWDYRLSEWYMVYVDGVGVGE